MGTLVTDCQLYQRCRNTTLFDILMSHKYPVANKLAFQSNRLRCMGGLRSFNKFGVTRLPATQRTDGVDIRSGAGFAGVSTSRSVRVSAVSSHWSSRCCAGNMTGIRSCSLAISALAAVVMMEHDSMIRSAFCLAFPDACEGDHLLRFGRIQ